MNITRISVYAVLITILANAGFADEKKENDWFSRTSSGLGVSAGILSGFGITYRQFVTDKLGFQLTAPGVGEARSYSAQFLLRPDQPNVYFIGGTSFIKWSGDLKTQYFGFGPGIEFTIIKAINLGASGEIPLIYALPKSGGKEPGIFPFPSINLLWHF